jgi:hypothetical protein
MHHIFVGYAQFDEWRRDTGAEVSLRTGRKLEEADMREEDRQPILNAAKSLFIDDPVVWPLKILQYYLGQTPSIQNFITYRTLPDTIKRRKLASHLSSNWHMSAIRLAEEFLGVSNGPWLRSQRHNLAFSSRRLFPTGFLGAKVF